MKLGNSNQAGSIISKNSDKHIGKLILMSLSISNFANKYKSIRIRVLYILGCSKLKVKIVVEVPTNIFVIILRI